MLELGPKRKKVVAHAPDWPGLERGATTEAEAIARLESYLPRYAVVAAGAEGVGDAEGGVGALVCATAVAARSPAPTEANTMRLIISSSWIFRSDAGRLNNGRKAFLFITTA